MAPPSSSAVVVATALATSSSSSSAVVVATALATSSSSSSAVVAAAPLLEPFPLPWCSAACRVRKANFETGFFT
jgi:hypothetical protein